MHYEAAADRSGWRARIDQPNGYLEVGYSTEQQTYYGYVLDNEDQYVDGTGVGGGWRELNTVEALTAALTGAGCSQALRDAEGLIDALRAAQHAN